MPYRTTPSVRHRAIEVHYYYYVALIEYPFIICNNSFSYIMFYCDSRVTLFRTMICSSILTIGQLLELLALPVPFAQLLSISVSRV